VDEIREQMNCRLRETLGDDTRRADAEQLVARVCDVLDQGDTSAEAVAETVREALASSLEQAEAALAQAEQTLRGRA